MTQAAIPMVYNDLAMRKNLLRVVDRVDLAIEPKVCALRRQSVTEALGKRPHRNHGMRRYLSNFRRRNRHRRDRLGCARQLCQGGGWIRNS